MDALCPNLILLYPDSPCKTRPLGTALFWAPQPSWQVQPSERCHHPGTQTPKASAPPEHLCTALLTSDADGQSSLHSSGDALHGAAVGGDVRQLPGVAGVSSVEETWQVIHRQGRVDGGVGVADGVHAVPQRDQDGSKQQRQADLYDGDQNLTFLRGSREGGVEINVSVGRRERGSPKSPCASERFLNLKLSLGQPVCSSTLLTQLLCDSTAVPHSLAPSPHRSCLSDTASFPLSAILLSLCVKQHFKWAFPWLLADSSAPLWELSPVGDGGGCHAVPLHGQQIPVGPNTGGEMGHWVELHPLCFLLQHELPAPQLIHLTQPQPLQLQLLRFLHTCPRPESLSGNLVLCVLAEAASAPSAPAQTAARGTAASVCHSWDKKGTSSTKEVIFPTWPPPQLAVSPPCLHSKAVLQGCSFRSANTNP